MKTKLKDFLNEDVENDTIYLKQDIAPETNPIFWESGDVYNVNLGNLVNAIKDAYGYKYDNFTEQENNMSLVVIGNEFINKEYPRLGELLKNGTEQTISLKSTDIPNQYSLLN